jgi:hypothetical protein
MAFKALPLDIWIEFVTNLKLSTVKTSNTCKKLFLLKKIFLILKQLNKYIPVLLKVLEYHPFKFSTIIKSRVTRLSLKYQVFFAWCSSNYVTPMYAKIKQ